MEIRRTPFSAVNSNLLSCLRCHPRVFVLYFCTIVKNARTAQILTIGPSRLWGTLYTR